MLQTLNNALNSFVHNIRFVDVLDIVLIAFVFYFILNWIQRNVSGRSLLGLGILVIVYSASRLTGMYLTELLIEAFFFVFIIGLFIVFQADIRQAIDRMGNWNIFGKKSEPPSRNISNVITEACAHMANNKTGALIAVKGDDNWERQVNGGIDLNGLITQPLLISIFNPKAPGHDGAVLIDESKIIRFGVHLPLSTRLKKLGPGGTRHAAALGLSEQCDAFVIVVSEERGEISTAKDGSIHKLGSNSDLKVQLDSYIAQHYGTRGAKSRRWWKQIKIKTAISALLLSLVLWLGLVYQPGTLYRTYDVPIEYRNIPEDSALPKDHPSTIRVTLSGPEAAFDNLDERDLVVAIDLSSEDAKNGIVDISSDNLDLPTDLKLYESTPSRLSIKLEKE